MFPATFRRRDVAAMKQKLSWIVVVFLLMSISLAAQTFRGTILGTVTDPTGALVPEARVTVKNLNTGLARETQTTNDGSYSVPELSIGPYSVTVEKEGFQTSVVDRVTVEGAAERRVDVSLQVGEITQRIEVSAATLPLVETTSNVLGGTLEARQVEE